MPASWELPSGASCSQAQGGRRGPSWQTPSELPGSGDISFPPPLALHSQRFLRREAIPAPRPPGTVPFCPAAERADSRLCTRPQPGQQLPGGEGLPPPTSPVLPDGRHLSQSQPSRHPLPLPWAARGLSAPAIVSRGAPSKAGPGRISNIWPCSTQHRAGMLETHITHWLSILMADLLLPCPIQSPAAGAR